MNRLTAERSVEASVAVCERNRGAAVGLLHLDPSSEKPGEPAVLTECSETAGTGTGGNGPGARGQLLRAREKTLGIILQGAPVPVGGVAPYLERQNQPYQKCHPPSALPRGPRRGKDMLGHVP